MKPDAPKIESLSSIDHFGVKRTIIPLEVKGYWAKRKVWLQWFLLVIFLVLPWIKINGNPIILLNIAERRFSFGGFLFFAHDAPLIFFIFAAAALALVLATALWGRVWCGYACPQTVFIERVYRQIETWIEGRAIARRKLLNQPFNLRTFSKKILKWILFFIVSSIFAHSFAAYFLGAEAITEMVQSPPSENWTSFLVVSFITTILLFDFGWFREQFCIIMCPYGRFQSVFMDEYSLSVIYDEKRGEPRKGLKSELPAGDCVSCNRCVEVCPTGIDIRQGVQMECIACTACIDACDEIMEKVKKPKGLIRYDNEARSSLNFFRPRILIFLSLLLLLSVSFILVLSNRNDLHVSLLRAKESPYQTLDNDTLINHFKLHIKNQSAARKQILIQTDSTDLTLITQSNPLTLPSHSDHVAHFFIKFPRSLLKKGLRPASVSIQDMESKQILIRKSFTLLGPNQ